MTAAAARGKLSKLALGSTSPTTYRIAFASFDHGCSTELLNTNEDVSVGTLTQPKERVVANRRVVRPRATLSPSLADWRQLVPWGLYGAETGTGPYTYAPANAPLARTVEFQNDAAKFFTMAGVGVDRMSLRARSGGALECELECVGLDYSNTGSFPNLSANVAPPLIFKSTGITINSVATSAQDVGIEVSNFIDADRFLNGATLAWLVNLRREVMFTATLPVGEHAALWDAATGDAGVAVAVTFAGPGGSSMLWSFPAVKSSPESWNTPGPGESYFTFRRLACGTAGTGNDEAAVTITLPS